MLNVEELYQTRARRHDDGAIRMRGGYTPADTLSGYIFVPNDDGTPTFVIPVFDHQGIIDILAIAGDVWGAVTGAASYLGTGDRIHRTPASWLAADDGVLPLSKSFLA